MYVTKEEKIVLVFILFCLTLGTGLNFYNKKRGCVPRKTLLNTFSKKDSFSKKSVFYDNKGKVNINKSDLKGLVRLNGIGRKTAMHIIDYRTKNGPFCNKEEIMKVKGIGRVKFEMIKDEITVK